MMAIRSIIYPVILLPTIVLAQSGGNMSKKFIDFNQVNLETNSSLFKIGKLEGEQALYLIDNKYNTQIDQKSNKVIDDVRGKVALIGDVRQNYSMGAELKFLGHHLDVERAGWFGFVIRAQDTSNYEVIWFMPAAEESNTVAYVSVAHGIVPWWTEAYSSQQKGSVYIPSDKWFSARVDVSEDEFSIYVEGQHVFTKKITYYLKEGRPGFFVGTATDAAIRRVTIKDLTEKKELK